MKQKADRNKTIDFSLEEGHEYLERCILAENSDQLKTALQDGSTMTPDALYDQYIIGDTFQVMKELPPNFVDLLIVDPPYNLAKDYHGNKFNAVGREEYREYTIKWVREVLPLLKKTASIYVCCDWRSSLIIGDVLQEYFLVQNRITWQREKGRGAKSNWKNGMEDIWFATVSRDYTFHLDEVKVRKRVLAPYRVDGNPKDWEETDEGRFRNTCPSNFWDDISIPYWSMPENTAHPTQKPEKLLAKLLLASSSKGDVVLDPFAGSGTTAVVAKKLGRKFVAIEQNPLYGAWAQKRLEMAETDASIQGYEDGVFWERNARRKKKGQEISLPLIL